MGRCDSGRSLSQVGGAMRRFKFSRWTEVAAAIAVVACAGTFGIIRLARGSDHQDTPGVAPAVSGKINTVLGSSGGIQVFAGWRDDPFFIDLEQFFRIIPDRKPVTGPLAQLADVATAGSFRSPGVDYVAGFNVLSIVIELPTAQLTAGGNAKIGVRGTISR